MRTVGLTGGLGAGKSTVAELLRQHGLTVVDLDKLGRKLLDDPSLAPKITEICGAPVASPTGVDRAKIREVIFFDEAKRRALEQLLHPLIWDQFVNLREKANHSGSRLIVCEAALLVESGLNTQLDALIVVTSPEELRRKRVVQRDRVSEALVERMFQAQLPEAGRLKAGTLLVTNDGSFENLSSQVNNLVDNWKKTGWI